MLGKMKIPLFLAEDYGGLYNFIFGVLGVGAISLIALIAGITIGRRQEEQSKGKARWLIAFGLAGLVGAGVMFAIAYFR